MTTNKYSTLRATIARAKRHDCLKVVMRVTLAEEILDQLSNAETRIAELEAKQVKIKLPESFYPDGDIECPLVINEYQIIEAIVAADCKPIAVCPRCKRELDLSHKHDGAHYCHATGTGKGE